VQVFECITARSSSESGEQEGGGNGEAGGKSKSIAAEFVVVHLNFWSAVLVYCGSVVSSHFLLYDLIVSCDVGLDNIFSPLGNGFHLVYAHGRGCLNKDPIGLCIFVAVFLGKRACVRDVIGNVEGVHERTEVEIINLLFCLR